VSALTGWPRRLKEKKVISDSAGKEGLREGQATANYAARKVLEALGNMFGNARSVMDWLNECAKEIAHHGALHPLPWCLRCLPTRGLPFAEDSVKWRTPVGLPVVQVSAQSRCVCAPTQADACSRSRTASAGCAACTPCCRPSPSRASAGIAVPAAHQAPDRVVRSYRTSCDFHPVMKSKQRTAFPPNYIHSLDSAHMMLTACATDKEGADLEALLRDVHVDRRQA